MICRYSCTSLRLPPIRPFAILHAPITAPIDTTDDPEHTYCHIAGLVSTMVLVKTVTRLDSTPEDITCLSG